METPREIEQSSWYLWDNSKHWNTWITGVAEGEKRKSGLGKKNIWRDNSQEFDKAGEIHLP